MPARGQCDVLQKCLPVDVDVVCISYGNDWDHIASRPKRALSSIVLDEGIKELLLEDARDFMKSKKWYADRGMFLIVFPILWYLMHAFRHSFPSWISPVRGSWIRQNFHHS